VGRIIASFRLPPSTSTDVTPAPNAVGSGKLPIPDVPDVVPHTRKTYAGPLEVGEDLMSIEIGDQVRVHRVP
jgi:hypothetical protein